MAIQFARIEYGSRSSGANACRKAAYNARESIKCERTGQVFSFKHRTDNIFHAVLLPEGVDPKFKDSAWRTLNLPHDWAVELPFVNVSSFES